MAEQTAGRAGGERVEVGQARRLELALARGGAGQAAEPVEGAEDDLRRVGLGEVVQQAEIHLGGDFLVLSEVGRHGRPPDVERVVGGKIPGLPGAGLRDLVEVVEVLGEAAPRVADVVEEVRADDVAPESPAGLPAAV